MRLGWILGQTAMAVTFAIVDSSRKGPPIDSGRAKLAETVSGIALRIHIRAADEQRQDEDSDGDDLHESGERLSSAASPANAGIVGWSALFGVNILMHAFIRNLIAGRTQTSLN